MSYKIKKEDGKTYYWDYDNWIEVLPKKRNKKSYLTKIFDILTEEPLGWYELVKDIGTNWDEPTNYDEQYVIKALIRGIKDNKLEKIESSTSKNKYKGHQYKLIIPSDN